MIRRLVFIPWSVKQWHGKAIRKTLRSARNNRLRKVKSYSRKCLSLNCILYGQSIWIESLQHWIDLVSDISNGPSTEWTQLVFLYQADKYKEFVFFFLNENIEWMETKSIFSNKQNYVLSCASIRKKYLFKFIWGLYVSLSNKLVFLKLDI